ncbi:putative glycoside hydrolase [Evansella sp. AB-P1]|uniref:putative glycoside hydrolase n=1 Tax=Evansella sp. AB-P1 TaxID=3037653 RepID=UPI0024203B2B|nr:putative glycoside hydrolase [Evansella sp. AB-P1]MDG5789139.1 putative glycoside hydrolase [Evansella sp. AB-P1]
MGKLKFVLILTSMLFFLSVGQNVYEANEGEEVLNGNFHTEKNVRLLEKPWPESIARFSFDSGFAFEYPDAVRGIFLTGHSAGHPTRFPDLVDFVDSTDLNAMVIDVKDDHGYLTFRPDEDSPFYEISQNMIGDPENMMRTLEEHQIYPIARIVVFKDSVLAEKRPDLSFTQNGQVWKNNRGEAFVNPFLEEVWEYNLDIAEKAVHMGFQEIQFDYVRFAEGFNSREDVLDYDTGKYKDGEDNVKRRVDAVSDFVAYAAERLEPYGVDVSVDIFGYTVTIEESPSVGQNFLRISEPLDVISSMPYPSHWTPHFGIDKPDLYPYELMSEYITRELDLLNQLDDPPTSRPWLQDFTASWLGSGNYIPYGTDEIEAQIRALYENGVNEFLLWNANNRYTQGVNYLNP